MYGRVLVAAVVLALSLAGCAASEGQGGDGGRRPAADRTKPVSAERSGTRTVKKREATPNGTRTHRTTQLDKGVRKVTQRGHDGVRVTTWRVTTKKGKVIERTKVRSVLTTKPVPRVVFIGTRVAPALVAQPASERASTTAATKTRPHMGGTVGGNRAPGTGGLHRLLD